MFSSEIIYDKDLFPTLPPHEPINESFAFVDDNDDNKSLITKGKGNHQHMMCNNLNCCNEHKSLAIACPLSRSIELTAGSKFTRFQERRYEQATWQMYYRIRKARVESGTY